VFGVAGRNYWGRRRGGEKYLRALGDGTIRSDSIQFNIRLNAVAVAREQRGGRGEREQRKRKREKERKRGRKRKEDLFTGGR
jgi:hypothetical protein